MMPQSHHNMDSFGLFSITGGVSSARIVTAGTASSVDSITISESWDYGIITAGSATSNHALFLYQPIYFAPGMTSVTGGFIYYTGSSSPLESMIVSIFQNVTISGFNVNNKVSVSYILISLS